MRVPIGNGWAIRTWELGDVPALARYANNRKIWLNMRDSFPHPYTPGHARTWVRAAAGHRPETQLAIASDSEAIGGIGITLYPDVHRGTAEIGYWVAEPYWGRGIATSAVTAFVEYAFTHFDLVRLQACVFEWNPASRRVLEKAGFTLEGRQRKSVTKDGKTIDMFVYALVREDG